MSLCRLTGARRYLQSILAHAQVMACLSIVVGVTAAREVGLFRGLQVDDSATDGPADMDFDGVWPGCALTVVCHP